MCCCSDRFVGGFGVKVTLRVHFSPMHAEYQQLRCRGSQGLPLGLLTVLALAPGLAQKRIAYSCVLGLTQTFPGSLASKLNTAVEAKC